jgi:hypothetical protein
MSQAAPTLVRAKQDTQHSSGVLAELARADAVPTEARASHWLLTLVPGKRWPAEYKGYLLPIEYYATFILCLGVSFSTMCTPRQQCHVWILSIFLSLCKTACVRRVSMNLDWCGYVRLGEGPVA